MHRIASVFLVATCMALQLDVYPAPAERSATMRTEAGNSYFAGAELTLNNAVQRDLFAAGGRVTVARPIGADAVVAGGSITIRSAVGQDLRVAGGNVSIDGEVGGELLAAGGTVSIASGATVAGSSLLGGSEVLVDGRLLKGARIHANRIVLDGEINGDARFYAQEIVFGPGAKIDGDLIYASPSPLSEEDLAKVSGRTVRERTPESWSEARSAGDGISWFHPVFFLSMLANGFVLYLLFPNAVNGVRENIARAPLRSIVVGLALMFTLPPVAVLLMVTVIGIPAGLGLFALYPLMLLLGYLAAAFFIGGKLADVIKQPAPFSKGKQVLFLAAALLLLTIAGAIPILGWLFVFLALTAGIGGWAIWAVRGGRAARAD